MANNNKDSITNVWVFGYGSLMWGNWETEFQGICMGKAILKGYHRSFNKKSTRNWGTTDVPCPTLGLEKSNEEECIGFVFKFNNNQRKAIEVYLKKREGESFHLVEIEVELEDGQKEMVLTPINRPEMSTYIDNTNINTLVDMVQNARGKDGSCFEYIQNIHTKCKEFEIKDEYVQKMWEGINYDVSTPKEVLE